MSASDHSDLFFLLTPEKVLEAVEAGGLETRNVCYPLNSFENRVYEVELQDRTRVVAKFYRPGRWSEEQILEEHRFLAELDAEEVPVCTVRPFPDGSTLKRIEGIYYSLSDRSGGRAPDELTDSAVERLGMLVGRLHNVGARQQATARPSLSADYYIRDEVAWFDAQATLPRHHGHRYVETALAIAEITEELMQGVAVQRVHADLHLGNVLLRDGVLRVLDFDDMVTGPPVQDLWLALPGRDRESLRQREIFIEGYEQFRAFERSTLGLIECLRGLRMVRYAGWLARRWHDPAFKAAWPHFGTDEYWQHETEDLEEQLSVIRGELSTTTVSSSHAVHVSARGEDVSELTNKDYFWDWEEN